jgi:DNA-binding HxlR family transcriptional regulator
VAPTVEPPARAGKKVGLSADCRSRLRMPARDGTLIPVSPEPDDYQMVRGTQTVLDLLSRKWSVGVLYLLARGTRRYSELFYEVGEVSKKALTQALRALERDGLVARRAFPEVPLRVEYSLTPLGWSMTSLLMTMYEWSATNEPHLEAARAEQVPGERPHLRLAA